MCNAISGRGNQKLIRQASGKPGDPKAYDGIIVRTEGTWSLNGRRGTYRFNRSTGCLETGEGEVLSRFQCQRIQERPLELPVNSYSKMGNLKILSSEIMTLDFFLKTSTVVLSSRGFLNREFSRLTIVAGSGCSTFENSYVRDRRPD